MTRVPSIAKNLDLENTSSPRILPYDFDTRCYHFASRELAKTTPLWATITKNHGNYAGTNVRVIIYEYYRPFWYVYSTFTIFSQPRARIGSENPTVFPFKVGCPSRPVDKIILRRFKGVPQSMIHILALIRKLQHRHVHL